MFQILNWRYWQDTIFRWRFFIALDRGIRTAIPNADHAGMRREIQRQSRAIYAVHVHRIVDEPSRWHLAWVSRVLAAYRIVRPIVNDQGTTLALLHAANEAPFRSLNPTWLLFIRYGISPFQPGVSLK